MLYHMRKVNVVADTLNRKTQICTKMLSTWVLVDELANWYPWPVGTSLICSAMFELYLIDQIWAAQT